jgi:hypothetical protein
MIVTDLDIHPASLPAAAPAPGWQRLGWRSVLALGLGLAAVTFAAALAFAPPLAWLGLPRDFSLTIAFAFVLTPIELKLLLRAAPGDRPLVAESAARRARLPSAGGPVVAAHAGSIMPDRRPYLRMPS